VIADEAMFKRIARPVITGNSFKRKSYPIMGKVHPPVERP
jgi:hypothetical protein